MISTYLKITVAVNNVLLQNVTKYYNFLFVRYHKRIIRVDIIISSLTKNKLN